MQLTSSFIFDECPTFCYSHICNFAVVDLTLTSKQPVPLLYYLLETWPL